MNEILVTISGNVQGVGYRAFTQDVASQLELVGYVKNLTDGRVEVCAQGTLDILKEFIEFLNEGSPLSVVSGVSAEWRSKTKKYDEFSILYL